MFLRTLIFKVIISITGVPVDSNVFNMASGFQIGDGHSTLTHLRIGQSCVCQTFKQQVRRDAMKKSQICLCKVQ